MAYVAPGDSMQFWNDIRYFPSQIVVNYLDVNELMRNNLHVP